MARRGDAGSRASSPAARGRWASKVHRRAAACGSARAASVWSRAGDGHQSGLWWVPAP